MFNITFNLCFNLSSCDFCIFRALQNIAIW